MKELVILSGKGGTGKTSVTAAFASLAENMVLCDADVDAADLHLILKPEIEATHEFRGGNEAIINPDACTQCGQCIELCRFDAVREDFVIDEIACEGCGVCVDLCPENAIDFPEALCGHWFQSQTRFGPMVHARLGIAQENSGKLVALVRQEARKRAVNDNLSLILTDGPPGVGCPVTAAMTQADIILIIAEPTVSGCHDMERVIELADHFKLPAMVCINKHDINPEHTENIRSIAEDAKVPVVGEIPYDPVFTKAMIREQSVVEYQPNAPVSRSIKDIWQAVQEQIEKQKTSIKLL